MILAVNSSPSNAITSFNFLSPTPEAPPEVVVLVVAALVVAALVVAAVAALLAVPELAAPPTPAD